MDDFSPLSTTRRLLNDADDAFREVRREAGDSKKWKGRKVMYFDNKEAVKKWIEKSFDLASELNSDFAISSNKRDSIEKFLRKYRRWADLLYSDVDVDVEVDVEAAETAGSEEGSESASNQNDQGDGGENGENKPVTVVNPHAEYTGDDETFRVAVDLPGVDKENIEVTVEDDSGFLIVEATRSSLGGGGNNNKERKYSKKIDFGFDEVEAEQMEASYDNGVLIVSAPKKKKEEKIETKRRIPIV